MYSTAYVAAACGVHVKALPPLESVIVFPSSVGTVVVSVPVAFVTVIFFVPLDVVESALATEASVIGKFVASEVVTV